MKLQYKALTSRALRDFADFSCGRNPWDIDLNDFLLSDALHQHRGRYNRTYLFYKDDQPAAYVTISADSIKRQHVLGTAPYDTIPTLLIGRLAVDRRFQGYGIGQDIMAWVRSRAISLWVGCRFIAVHVEPENTRAIGFYEQQSFFHHPHWKRQLKLMLYDLIASK